MRAVTPISPVGRVVVLVAVIAAVVAAGCGGSLPNYDYSKEPDPRSRELTLGVGDTIGINVWENKDLNTEATIRPDGTITMPLIGDIKAVGEFVKVQNTEITVAVRSYRSYRFTIQGEVTHAGVFSAEQYVTVADALALAGGPSKFAKRGEITLLRRDPKSGDIRKIPLDYDLIASGKRQDMNIYVLTGDTIWVP